MSLAADSKAGLTAGVKATGTIQLCIKLDYPPKTQFTKVEAKTATLTTLKAEIGKLFSLSDSELAKHSFRSVGYGTNTSHLGQQKTGENTLLVDDGVGDKHMILVTAPTELKPVRVFDLKKKDGDGDEDEEVDNDKYKGLKPATIVKVMQMAKGKDELVALEFFDMHAPKAMKTNDFLQLEQKRVMQLIQRNTLNIKEGELFEAVVAWGKAEAKRQNTEATPENLRKILDKLLGHVRFPCMAMDEVATKVTPSGILTGEQMLSVFTYLGLTKDKAAKLKMQWPTVPRTGRRPPNFFTWDATNKHYLMQLSDRNMVAFTTDPNNWQCVSGNLELKKGVHEWEIVLQQYDQQNGYNVVVGVVPSYWNNWSVASWIGASANAPGWAFICGNGYKTNTGTGQVYYGRAAAQGDVIKIRCDLDAHTIEFSINGQSMGQAFADVYGPVRPALAMVRPQRVQLRFPNKAGGAYNPEADRRDYQKNDDDDL